MDIYDRLRSEGILEPVLRSAGLGTSDTPDGIAFLRKELSKWPAKKIALMYLRRREGELFEAESVVEDLIKIVRAVPHARLLGGR